MVKFRRLLTLLLAMLMLMSCNVGALAATKPTSKCTSHPTTVKRGKTAKFKFKVKVGSYSYKSNFYRAGFATAMTYKQSNAKTRAYLAKAPAKAISGFPADGTMTQKWKLPRDWAAGKYKFVYATFYRSKNSSSAWRINKNDIKMFTVKVK